MGFGRCGLVDEPWLFMGPPTRTPGMKIAPLRKEKDHPLIDQPRD